MSVCEVAAFCADATSGNARNTAAATIRVIDRLASVDARLETLGVLVVDLFIWPHSSEHPKVVVPKDIARGLPWIAATGENLSKTARASARGSSLLFFQRKSQPDIAQGARRERGRENANLRRRDECLIIERKTADKQCNGETDTRQNAYSSYPEPS